VRNYTLATKKPTVQGANAQYDLIIEPGTSLRNYWRDLWQYRELFYFLSWRDILVRYKQTAIGIAWGVLRPLLTMIVFTVIFGYLAKLPSEGVPYPILVFAAMLPWQFFSSSLTESSNSFITNANMLTKIYFPRLIVPASAVIVNLVDFLISFAILAVLMAWYRFVPNWRIVTLPAFLFLASLASMGFGLWLATLNIKYRDFRYVVPFLVQFGLYVSPVGFSSSVVPGKWRLLYSLNPMVGVIDGFRWAILGGNSHIYWPGFLLSSALAVLTFLLAIRYFRNAERKFADII
jgi:lipopolysaccharide transport system permease protein